MSVAEVMEASPDQILAIKARDAFLRVSQFLGLHTDHERMVFAPPIGVHHTSNMQQVILRDFDDVRESYRGHIDYITTADVRDEEFAYHRQQATEEEKAIRARNDYIYSRPPTPPVFLLDV